MHSIIYCDSHDSLPYNTNEIIFSMMNIANKSIAFHCIEQLCKLFTYLVDNKFEKGQNKITFITNNNPSLLRAYLGEGERWGCEIEVISLMGSLETTVKAIQYKNYLDGIEDSILFFPKYMLYDPQEYYVFLINILSNHNKFINVQKENIFQNSTVLYIDTHHIAHVVRINYDCICNIDDVYNADMKVLDSAYPWLVLEEQVVESLNNKQHGIFQKNIYIGRHCYIDKEATLYPPVRIGHNCRLEKGCEIGPYASIGATTIVDNHAKLKNSVVYDDTYIAPLVSVENSYVIHDNIHQIKKETCVLSPSMLVQSHSKVSITNQYKDNVSFFKNILCTITFKVILLSIFLCMMPIILTQWLLGKCQFEQFIVEDYDETQNMQCYTSLEKVYTVFWRVHPSAPHFLRTAKLQYLPSILLVLLGKVPLIGKEFWVQETNEVPQLKMMCDSSLHMLKKGLLPPYLGLARAPMSDIEKTVHLHWYAKKSNICLDLKILKGLFLYSYGRWKAKTE